jgi:hypothetical protein
VSVKVTDECPPCGYDNIDLPPSAFAQLTDKGEYIWSSIYVQS